MLVVLTKLMVAVFGRGDAWHNLRRDNFEQVKLDDCPELLGLIKRMMRSNPTNRLDAHQVRSHVVVSRAREAMEKARRAGGPAFDGSPLASVPDAFLGSILGRGNRDYGEPMDLSP